MSANYGTGGPSVFTTPRSGPLGGAVLIIAGKNLVAKVTVADGDKATDSAVPTTPIDNGYVIVDVNGIIVGVGNGAKDKEVYFSNDGGTTARQIQNISAGDTIHWMGSIAGYQLDVTDRISLNYDV